MNVDVKRRWADQEVERRAPSVAFLDALSELMDGDDRVVALASDDAAGLGLGNLSAEYSGRVIRGGSADHNLIGMAAGLASMGKVPVVIANANAAALGAGRSLLLAIARGQLHVVVVGYPAGLAGMRGAPCHGLADLAGLGAMPGLRLVVPADAEETAKALLAVVDEPGPAYLRLTDEALPALSGPDSPFDLGRITVMREGDQVTLVASGPPVYEALVAADRLEDQGMAARVLAAHTVEPLDIEAIEAAARDTGALVVLEEHAPSGGLGARVCQVLSRLVPVPVEHLHTGPAVFANGSPAELRALAGLTAEQVVGAAQRVVGRKAT